MIVSSLGELVGGDDDAGGRRHALGELEPGRRAVVVEHPLARTENQRVDEQHELIDQIVSYEGAHELTAAKYGEVHARLVLECGDRLFGVTHEERRVPPGQWFVQRSRDHV